MQPHAPPADGVSRRERVFILAAVVAIAVALAALVAGMWYPTTLQPVVTLTNTPFVATHCAPLLLGGYADEYNTTLVLVNTGRADADASVQFLFGNLSLGYRHYTVPQGGQVTDNASLILGVSSSPTNCTSPMIRGAPALALASVDRLPPIDQRALVYATIDPVATAGFAGVLLAVISVQARRRGLSLLRDFRGESWGLALLVTFAAVWFGATVSSAATLPYDQPMNWTLLAFYGAAGAAICILPLWGTWRFVLRTAPPDRVPSRGGRERPPSG